LRTSDSNLAATGQFIGARVATSEVTPELNEYFRLKIGSST